MLLAGLLVFASALLLGAGSDLAAVAALLLVPAGTIKPSEEP